MDVGRKDYCLKYHYKINNRLYMSLKSINEMFGWLNYLIIINRLLVVEKIN